MAKQKLRLSIGHGFPIIVEQQGDGGGGEVTDHGGLSGLSDDDHPQYALSDGTRGNFEVAGAISTHESAVDPHPNYALESSLGTAATQNGTAFATAAQGTLADSALQPGDDIPQGDVTGLSTALSAKADLVGGVIPTAQIPAIAISQYLGSVANESAMLALAGQTGDWCTRQDTASPWMLADSDATQLSSWIEFVGPTAPVTTVNGQTGAVVLSPADIGLGNVDNTADADKPVSTATQSALNAKAPLASPALTGTPTAPTAAASTDTTQIATTAMVQAAIAADIRYKRPNINAQTGISYTLALVDDYGIVTMDNAGANTLTIPTNASVALPVPTLTEVFQIGLGTTTISAASGVTLNGVNGGSVAISARYGPVSLRKIAADAWLVAGAIGDVA